MTASMRPEIEHPPYFTRITGPADTSAPIEPDPLWRIKRHNAPAATHTYGYTNCTSNDDVPNPKKQPKAHPFAKFIKRRKK